MYTNPAHMLMLAGGGGDGAEVAVNAVTFDGRNDYLTRTTALDGVPDSKLWTGSFWFRLNRARRECKFWDQSGRGDSDIRIERRGELEIRQKGTGGGGSLSLESNRDTEDTNWHHLMWSVDMSAPRKRHLYLDDVSRISVRTYSNVNLDFTGTVNTVGAEGRGRRGGLLDGDLAEFWMYFGQYIDLGIESKRRKFISVDGKPVNLGTDGAGPAGTSPHIYLTGDTGSWHINKGTGGGFTENGALTTAATSPSD